MPKFKSIEEAHRAHRNYHIDTDQEGKYNLMAPFPPGILRVKWLMDKVPEGSYLLEVGCNSGGFCRLLMDKKQCYARGIDVCAEMVGRAVSKGVNAVEGVAEKLPFKDESFEVVLMTEVMEHLYDPHIVLKEIKRVLKPGGIFIGSVPHEDSHNSTKKTLDEHDYHCMIFTRKNLFDLLNKYFNVLEVEDIPWNGDVEKKPQWITWRCSK